MSNNSKKKTNNKNNRKENKAKEVSTKNVVKKGESKTTVKVEEVKKEVKPAEEVKKEKKSFSLNSKQKDILLILLVVVLLVVGLVLTSGKKDELNVELPVLLEGEAGFTEITYADYEQKMKNNEFFVVVIERDGCGYCEMYQPIVEEVTSQYNIPFYYINLAHLSEEELNSLSTSNTYLKRNDWGTPTTLFMYGTKVVDSISGYVEKDALVSFVKENFKVEE